MLELYGSKYLTDLVHLFPNRTYNSLQLRAKLLGLTGKELSYQYSNIKEARIGKICNCCGIDKNLEDFYKIPTKHGYTSECKMCISQKSKQKYELNPEPIKERVKKYRINNLNKVKEFGKKHYLNNKQKYLDNVKKYRLVNKERLKPLDRAKCAKRRSIKKRAVPKWSDADKIKDIYKKATLLNLEVDHVVPLQNDKVCGLHCEDNLQLLSSGDNKSKSNKYWPDM